VRPLSVGARLTAWYVIVLSAATLAVAGGAWWLFRSSLVRAADSTLAEQIEGTRRFIETTATALPHEELIDEFHEYAELTLGTSLLEVTDAKGTALCAPQVAQWDQLRVPVASDGRLAFADRAIGDRPFRVAAARLIVQQQPYAVVAALPMAAGDAALHRFGWMLIALVPAVLALAAAGGYAISRRALRPVDRMTQAVRSITVRDLDARLDLPPGDDELHRLAATFNDMLARLQRGVADMTRFTAEASHELRTPVALMRTTAEVALTRERQAGEYSAALADVLTQAERMSALVDDLLALTREDAGARADEDGRADPAAIAREIARGVEVVAVRRGIRCEVVASGETIGVAMAPVTLRRVLMILTDNAITYSAAGGVVTLHVASDPGGRVVIEVSDTGPGIDPRDRPHVFERFYRGSAARQHAPDGTGLGLPIAKAIVERHHGSIAIDSSARTGCTVRVELPASG